MIVAPKNLNFCFFGINYFYQHFLQIKKRIAIERIWEQLATSVGKLAKPENQLLASVARLGRDFVVAFGWKGGGGLWAGWGNVNVKIKLCIVFGGL